MDLTRLKDYHTFGLNKIFLHRDFSDLNLSYLVSVNSIVAKQIKDNINDFFCPKFLSFNTSPDTSNFDEFKYFLFTRGSDYTFSKDIRRPIHEGWTVTFVAMQIAFFMGFRRVFLIGVDHSFEFDGKPNAKQTLHGNDPNHFHPNYFGDQEWHLPDLEASELSYRMADFAFRRSGRKIVDATVDGELDIFPKWDFDRALEACKAARTSNSPVKTERKFGSLSIGGSRKALFCVESRIEKHRTLGLGDEKQSIQTFLQHIRPSDVVYDIGASVGLYTVLTAILANTGHVYSFEPDPATLTRLNDNVTLNNLSNVSTLPWAIGDSNCSCTLYSDGVNGYAPSLIKSEREGAPQGTVEVPMKKLDDIVGSDWIDPPDVLKIDVEGYEIECLEGCHELLSGKVCDKPRVVFIETHPGLSNTSEDAVRSAVKSCGYKLKWSIQRDDQHHYIYKL